jgi:hypothetical protein
MRNISEGGRWAIFSGVLMFAVVLLLIIFPKDLPFERKFGTTASAYITLAIVLTIGAISMMLYYCVPRRMIIPIGIAGWILTFSLTCWYFWFGPGALKM